MSIITSQFTLPHYVMHMSSDPSHRFILLGKTYADYIIWVILCLDHIALIHMEMTNL